jgi:hypothetical protein
MTELSLRLAYGFNILVLAPVLFGLYSHQGDGVIAALGGSIRNDDGLRLLVASLCCAVLLMSVAGLFAPRLFVALLVFQVVYKAIYLATYVGPDVATQGWNAAPQGPAVVFAIIIAVYPSITWRAWT